MKRLLRIAILPHLGRPIQADTGAARSRVIYDLIDGLVKRGHKVTLLGTADSPTPARLIPVAPTGVFLMPPAENDFYRHIAYLVQAISKLVLLQQEFDIVHNHMYPEFLPLLVGSQLTIPMVTTIHTQMSDYLVSALRQFPQTHLVALSQSHRRQAEGLTIQEVIYNGIDMQHFSLSEKGGEYLLFVGRIKIMPQKDGTLLDPKGVLTAIAVAENLAAPLRISGSVEEPWMFERYLKPHLSEKIQFVGKVSKEAPLNREQVKKLYQGARALLFPVAWDEPFGLVMVEAMACGTPVIAFNRGSVPEIVRDGVTGFIVEPEEKDATGPAAAVSRASLQFNREIATPSPSSPPRSEVKTPHGKPSAASPVASVSPWIIKKQGIAGLVAAVSQVDQLDRRQCRAAVEERFTKETMVENYERLYYKLLNL